MRATLDFPEKPLDDIIGANGLPVFLWIRIEGQAGLQISLQTSNGRRIHRLILLDKSRHRLISRLPIFLLEQGFQFWLELLLLFRRDIAEHVVHFMNHTALTS